MSQPLRSLKRIHKHLQHLAANLHLEHTDDYFKSTNNNQLHTILISIRLAPPIIYVYTKTNYTHYNIDTHLLTISPPRTASSPKDRIEETIPTEQEVIKRLEQILVLESI